MVWMLDLEPSFRTSSDVQQWLLVCRSARELAEAKSYTLKGAKAKQG